MNAPSSLYMRPPRETEANTTRCAEHSGARTGDHAVASFCGRRHRACVCTPRACVEIRTYDLAVAVIGVNYHDLGPHLATLQGVATERTSSFTQVLQHSFAGLALATLHQA